MKQLRLLIVVFSFYNRSFNQNNVTKPRNAWEKRSQMFCNSFVSMLPAKKKVLPSVWSLAENTTSIVV